MVTDRSPETPPEQPVPALVVVDVQVGFRDAAHWGERDNPRCEANIGTLLGAFRSRRLPVVLVRHDSTEPGSPLRTGTRGNALADVVVGPHDLLVSKAVNSAFLGTPDLAAWLRAQDLERIVVCGVTTNHCCETTARMGGNLGFAVDFVLDATYTFGRTGPDGHFHPADRLSAVTAANLDREFARVTSTTSVVAALPGSPAPGEIR